MAMQDPTLAAAWASVCRYCTAAKVYIVQVTQQLVQYLQVNAPIWLEIARDNTYNAITYVKTSIESMLK